MAPKKQQPVGNSSDDKVLSRAKKLLAEKKAKAERAAGDKQEKGKATAGQEDDTSARTENTAARKDDSVSTSNESAHSGPGLKRSKRKPEYRQVQSRERRTARSGIALRINAFHNILSQKDSERISQIARDPQKPMGKDQRQKLDALEDWLQTVRTSFIEGFSADVIACALQDSPQEGAIPFLKTSLVPAELCAMRSDSISLPDQDALISACQQPWTQQASEEDFEHLEPEEESLVTKDQSSPEVSAPAKSPTDLRKPDTSSSIDKVISLMQATNSKANNAPEYGHFASKDQTAKVLSAWKGFPRSFKPRGWRPSQEQRKGAGCDVAQSREKLFKGKGGAVQKHDPTSGQEGNLEKPIYKRFCIAAAHSPGDVGEDVVAAVLLPEADSQRLWYADTSSKKPNRMSTDNKNATEEFKSAKQGLAAKGRFASLSLEDRRPRTLSVVREKLWPNDGTVQPVKSTAQVTAPSDQAKAGEKTPVTNTAKASRLDRLVPASNGTAYLPLDIDTVNLAESSGTATAGIQITTSANPATKHAVKKALKSAIQKPKELQQTVWLQERLSLVTSNLPKRLDYPSELLRLVLGSWIRMLEHLGALRVARTARRDSLSIGHWGFEQYWREADRTLK
ncbi:hypothetical protein OPT61_g5564 [Boeremia exigua]|uniref:Uncharacterized protein n=1 Tax=Boeremia exigua TaxID=749465 RepID=A0ACC2I9T7_9PLEO|nr:hypothetical protein OPT61_g5564 [Boeremia exigua]